MADQVRSGTSSKGLRPVDVKLSTVKPLGVRWMIELHDYIKSKPNIVMNGFKNVGIVDILTK